MPKHKATSIITVSRGVARIFQRGGHTVSHPGNLQDCHADMLLKVTLFRLSSERGGGKSLQNSSIDELSSM